jgi:uncharacterized repeat protein (TIGR01451 family)
VARTGGDDNDNNVLDAGETWEYSASYVVRPTDPDLLTNTATVSGRDRDNETVSATGSDTVNIEFSPTLRITKSGPATAIRGQKVTYTFAVSHFGGDGSPVNSVGVNDNVAGPATYAGGDNGNGRLEMGETWTYTASYTIPPTGPDPLLNSARVTAKDKDGQDVTATSNTHSLDVINPPLLSITKSGPLTATLNTPFTYTLTVANSGEAVANNLVVTDVIPAGATYVRGGTRVGNAVRWTRASLASGASAQFHLVVSASRTITNSDYRVAADGGVSAVGQNAVSTIIVEPAPGIQYVYLPLIARPSPTILSVHNDNTGGDVTVIVRTLGTNTEVTRCTVPNKATLPCDHNRDGSNVFPPGTYNVYVASVCGPPVTVLKTYDSGPQTTRVFCLR